MSNHTNRVKDKLELLRLKHLFTTNLFRMANSGLPHSSLSCFIRHKTLGCASRFISDKTLLYTRVLNGTFITYLLRLRETVCFVDPRPPLLPEATRDRRCCPRRSRWNGGRGATKHTAFPRSQ